MNSCLRKAYSYMYAKVTSKRCKFSAVSTTHCSSPCWNCVISYISGLCLWSRRLGSINPAPINLLVLGQIRRNKKHVFFNSVFPERRQSGILMWLWAGLFCFLQGKIHLDINDYIRLHLHFWLLMLQCKIPNCCQSKVVEEWCFNILKTSFSFQLNLSCEKLSFKLQTWLFADLNFRHFSSMHLATVHSGS